MAIWNCTCTLISFNRRIGPVFEMVMVSGSYCCVGNNKRWHIQHIYWEKRLGKKRQIAE